MLALSLLLGVAWAQLPPGFPGPPPPAYMVDNVGNTFGVAPDKANFTGSVTSNHNTSLGLGLSKDSAPRSAIYNITRRHAHSHVGARVRTHVHHHSHGVKAEEHQDVPRSDSGYWLEYLADQGLVSYY